MDTGYIVFARKWIVEANKAKTASTVKSKSDKSSIIGKPQHLFELGISCSVACIGTGRLNPDFICTVIFSSNLIGVVFARSLHYQFYSWYFHTLPYLLSRTGLPALVRVALLFAVEVCFNVYPSTWWSSALLQVRVFLTLKP